MRKRLLSSKLLALLLLMAALATGLTAQATKRSAVIFQGATLNSQYVFVLRSDEWGQYQKGPTAGSSYTFSNEKIISSTKGDVTLNGKLIFQEVASAADVVTGSSFTMTITSTKYWFYGATVHTRDDVDVSGCSYTVSSNNQTLTVTIPSGKTFGYIMVDYVTNTPISSSNTVITGVEDTYLYLGSPIEPEPIVTYNGRALTKGTDYTVSYWGSNKVGTAQLTVTGTGEYAGDIRKSYTIRKVALTDFNSLGNNTYEIATTTDLDYLSLYIGGNDHGSGITFKQTADIAYNYTTAWNQGGENNFTPIGGYGNSFRGTYDGQNYTISGIRINKTDTTDNDGSQGLFGYLSGGTVKNVILADANICGHKNTGGIVGYNSGTIEDCRVESNVLVKTAKGTTSLGGIAGISTDYNTAIRRCIFKGNVQHIVASSSKIGGIVGTLGSSTVSNCLALGAHVSGSTYSGAIAGVKTGTSGVLTANYYHDCTVRNKVNSGASVDVGVGIGDGSEDQDGARSVHALTLPDGVTATGESVDIDNVTHYAAATTVTLSCSKEGYSPIYSVDGNAIEGDTFTMPAADAAVTVQFVANDYTITLPSNLEHVTVTSDVATAHIGDTVTLTVTPDEDYGVTSVTVMNGNTQLEVTAGEGNTYTFVMPAADVTVSVEVQRLRYTFNSETGVLKLIYGEFNQDNKWGSDVQASAVTSVKATDEVSFTGNCSQLFIGFSHCTSMDLNEVTTTDLENTNQMFASCSSLDTLDLSGWNTSGVTDMGGMFNRCSSLSTLNLTGWDVSKVTVMGNMFNACSDLETLDLSGWNTGKVTNMGAMFRDCSNLTTIYVGEGWSTEKVTSSYSMFEQCTNLVGGMGTAFDANHIDGEYARYDKGEDEPGYLTGVFTITLPEDVTTTAVATLTHNGVNYYKGGSDITLSYNGTPAQGTRFDHFTVGGEPIEGDTFAMPFANAEVGVEFQGRYTYNSTTGELALLWGAFNKADNWGSDVQASAVTSVTATDEVRFTGDCVGLFYEFTGCTSMDLSKVNTDSCTNMGSMFSDCRNLASLDLSAWNTTNVTNMSEMFYNCSALDTLDLTHLDTGNVTKMNSMFDSCTNLASLDLSGWNTASVTNMGVMFKGCTNLTTIEGLSDFNTVNVTEMGVMFSGCRNLASLDLSGWDTGNVTDMQYMFNGCSALETLDLSGWNTGNVRDMRNMFYGCSALETLNVSHFDTGNVNVMQKMFQGCSSLTTLDLSTWNTGNVAEMLNMFFGCTNLTTLDLSTWNTGNVFEMSYMFSGCTNLTTIYVGEGWTTEYLNNSNNMFFDCTNLVGGMSTEFDADHVDGEYARYDKGEDEPGYLTGVFALTLPEDVTAAPAATLTHNGVNYYKAGHDVTLSYGGEVPEGYSVIYSLNGTAIGGDTFVMPFEAAVVTVEVQRTRYTYDSETHELALLYGPFNRADKWGSDVRASDVTSVTATDQVSFTGDCTGLFEQFSNCETMDLSKVNTDSCTIMAGMFGFCSSLETLDLSAWNTASVTSMYSMFSYCTSLETLDLTGWNTAAVTDMREMFHNCNSLTTIEDISGWNIEAVASMFKMFYNCKSLSTLDLTGWNTAAVFETSMMLRGCTGLTTLDLSTWDTGKLNRVDFMFEGCSNLTTIYVGDGWTTENVTVSDGMFEGCTKLVGGMGTTYDADHYNKEYARYDKGEDEPGYLTGVFALTLPEDVTATPAATLVHGDVTLYAAGDTITLSYGGEVPEGYSVIYTVNGTAIGGDTFVMPFEAATVTVEVQRVRYTYDPATGELALLYGPFNKDDKWGADVPIADVTSVTATDQVRFTGDCKDLFYNFTGCTSMDLSKVNTDSVTIMTGMFAVCSSLETLDLTGWNTANVTDMYSMFTNCSSLTTIEGLSDFNTSNVTNMTSMFSQCSSLTSLDLSGWDVSNVTEMTTMFYNCSSLESLNISGWNTESVTSMISMFAVCSSLETLDLKGWDVSKAYMYNMFDGCSSLTTLDVSDWAIGSADFCNLFINCTGLTTLDLSTWNTSGVINMGSMFNFCSNLTTIYVGAGWTTENITISDGMFAGSTKLVGGMGTTYDADHINKEYARMDHGEAEPGYLTGVFALTLPEDVTATPAATLVHGDVTLYAAGDTITLSYGGEVPEGYSPKYTVNGTAIGGDTFVMPFEDAVVTVEVQRTRYTYDSATGELALLYGPFNKDDKWGDDVPSADVTSVTATDEVRFTGNCRDLFVNFTNCTSMDLSKVNTDSVTNMGGMFSYCSSLETLDLTGWNTANVTNMGAMFAACSSLTTIDGLSDFDTGNATVMTNMFTNCISLETLDLSRWNIGNVTIMSNMFGGCSSLETLDLSGWDVRKVTEATLMFQGCSSLTTLDVSNWTIGTANFTNLFFDCTGITTLDLSTWDTSGVTSMVTMFQNCSNLTTIYVGEGWSTESATNTGSMFLGCTKLVGGMGTTYDADHINKEYARIDRGEDEPGYLTGVFALTLPEDVTATPAATLVHGDVTLYAAGDTITLSYGGEVPEGYSPKYTVNGTVIGGDTFTMPFEAAVVTVEVQRVRYTYDPATGELALLYGPFNKDDKWGADVPIADVTSVTATDEVRFTGDCTWLFNQFSNCETMDLSKVNTDSCTIMGGIFGNCTSLETLDLTGWNTENVTNMYGMFAVCSSLTTVEGLSGFETGNVTNMSDMFVNCSSLEALDLSGWNTGNVTNMSNMFFGCSSLTTLDLSGWDVSKVSNMTSMFNGCSSLTTLDVSNWTIGSASFSSLFINCTGLTTLDLSTWNTSGVTNMGAMFIVCSNLTTIYVGEGWSTENVPSSHALFSGCTKLVGGMGTTYDADHINKEYARYDRGDDEPGYLTGVFALTLPEDVTTTPAATLVHGDVTLYAAGDTITLSYGGEVPEGYSPKYTVNGTAISGDTFVMPFEAAVVTVEVQRVRYTYDSATGVLALLYGPFNKDDKWGDDVPTDDVTRVTATSDVSFTGDCAYLFSNFTNCESMDLSKVNTGNCTNMASMFLYSSNLTTLDLSGWNTGNVTYMNAMFASCTSLTTIKGLADFNTGNVTNMTSMFNGCRNLDSLDISGWDVSNVTNTNNMFTASGLKMLDLSSWNVSNVTQMGSMFFECSNLETLNLSGWNTSKVNSMYTMFSGCTNLTTLNLSGWTLQNVSGMPGMVRGCSSLTQLDVSNWTIGSTPLFDIFANCTGLTTLDLSTWNTAGVTNMYGMFAGSSNLTTIFVGEGWSTENVTRSNDMFAGCTSLVGGMGTAYDADHIDGEYARIDRGEDEPGYLTGVFALTLPDDVTTTPAATLVHGDVTLYAAGDTITLSYGGEVPDGYSVIYSLNGTAISGDTFTMPFEAATVTVEVQRVRYTYDSATGVLALLYGPFNKDDKWGDDVPTDDVTRVTATDAVSFTGDCSYLFSNFTNCTSMDLSKVNTDNVTDMNDMFYYCYSLETLDLSGWNTANVTDMDCMFQSCQSLTTIEGLSGFNTGNVTDMYAMFYECYSLGSLDLSGWDTGNVTDMDCMFEYCTSLESLDITGWNTANVTGMSYMFDGCTALETLDLSHFDTGNVTDMYGMFLCCSALETLDVSHFDTGNVTDMTAMFNECTNLETLDLTSWNTGNVTDMTGLFFGCSALETLDLTSWNTENVTDMTGMFFGCTNLTTIYAGAGWNTEKVLASEEMFIYCTKLVGGMGTTYDADHIDKEYARIDRGEAAPGYLTGLFSITLPENIKHGMLAASQGDKVLVNGDMVVTGSTVTLTVAPEKGYKLQSLTVTIAGGEDEPSGAPMRLRGGTVELTDGDEPNTYTFEMPAAPVEVNAVFKKSTPTDVDDINANKPTNGQRYNLLGQPVGPDYKGIVIENGRKIYVE